MLLCDYYSTQLKKPTRYEGDAVLACDQKAYMSQINVQHGKQQWRTVRLKIKKGYAQKYR